MTDGPDLTKPCRSPARHPRDRLADQGPRGALQAWARAWWGVIAGVWLVGISLALLVIAFQVRAQGADAAASAAAAQRTSAASCRRTMKFSPELANAYERYGILSADALAEYRRTIPTSCP